MFKISYQTLVLIIIGIIGFIFALKTLTPEDTWICQQGQWVKHGRPSSKVPTTPCPR